MGGLNMIQPNWIIASSPYLDRQVAADVFEEVGDTVRAAAIRAGISGSGDGSGSGNGDGNGYGDGSG